MNTQADKELYYPYQYYTLNVARVIATQNWELIEIYYCWWIKSEVTGRNTQLSFSELEK